MKTTVTINGRGVVTLPVKLRQALGLQADDQLIAETTAEGLLLRPAVTLAVEVYSPEREREFDDAEADLAAVLGPKLGAAAGTPRALIGAGRAGVPGDNILFSAANADGAVRALLRLLLDRGHGLRVDAYVVAEARRAGQKRAAAIEGLDTLLGHLQIAPALAGGVESQALGWLPAKDRPVLLRAIRLGCDALVRAIASTSAARTGCGSRRDDALAAFAGRGCSGLSASAVRAALAATIVATGRLQAAPRSAPRTRRFAPTCETP